MYTIITNNPLITNKYQGISKNITIEYQRAGDCLQVLKRVRDMIHEGRRLETHPMAGSVKPNQNPYKTVLISDASADGEEFKEFIIIIENSIETAERFISTKPLPQWPDNILKDFMEVDYSLIRMAIERLLQNN